MGPLAGFCQAKYSRFQCEAGGSRYLRRPTGLTIVGDAGVGVILTHTLIHDVFLVLIGLVTPVLMENSPS